MSRFFQKCITCFLALTFGFLPVSRRVPLAREHLVEMADLRAAVWSARQARQGNLTQVRSFFSSDTAKKALQLGKIDLVKVEKAIPSLSDHELARLAVQTEKIEKDLAAGALTNEQITYLIIALATATVILVILIAGDDNRPLNR